MFKTVTSLVILLSFQNHYTVAQEQASDVEERIELLKQKIRAEIEENERQATRDTTLYPNDAFYEYIVIDPEDAPIEPIIQYHDKKHKHKHKRNKTAKIATSNDPHEAQPTTKAPLLTSPVTNDAKKTTPADVFYRRLFFDDQERNKPQKWTHCLDLVTPYLNGFKDDLSPKQITVRDGTVVRLIQLLSINTTGHSKEDIVSILYQISNLRLRIFQWDVTAITTLFNTIIRDNVHSFKTLKSGLKDIFRKWHLDTTNVGTFLKQTRIFRPPCIKISDHEGSTKSSKITRFTTPGRKGSDSDCND